MPEGYESDLARIRDGRDVSFFDLHSIDQLSREDDAIIEDVIGRTWQLAELREKGYFQTDLALFELAFELEAAQPWTWFRPQVWA